MTTSVYGERGLSESGSCLTLECSTTCPDRVLDGNGVVVTYGQEQVMAITLSKAAFRDMYHDVKKVFGTPKCSHKPVNRLNFEMLSEVSQMRSLRAN